LRVPRLESRCLVFAINVLAPYLLTALITRPQRLVYLSSGMHTGGDAALDDPQWEKRRWNGAQAYADSKLDDLLLALAVARHWPGVRSNAVEPGWVPTKTGGPGATDDLSLAPVTQAWLAAGDDPHAACGRQWAALPSRRAGAAAGHRIRQYASPRQSAHLVGVQASAGQRASGKTQLPLNQPLAATSLTLFGTAG
jgi:NAD(P)-dependent dehydrogenase (short-subunit alcohol dehydrogenase family)